jgi:hypothetical protein
VRITSLFGRSSVLLDPRVARKLPIPEECRQIDGEFTRSRPDHRTREPTPDPGAATHLSQQSRRRPASLPCSIEKATRSCVSSIRLRPGPSEDSLTSKCVCGGCVGRCFGHFYGFAKIVASARIASAIRGPYHETRVPSIKCTRPFLAAGQSVLESRRASQVSKA